MEMGARCAQKQTQPLFGNKRSPNDYCHAHLLPRPLCFLSRTKLLTLSLPFHSNKHTQNKLLNSPAAFIQAQKSTFKKRATFEPVFFFVLKLRILFPWKWSFRLRG
jgi:hypothetical protein